MARLRELSHTADVGFEATAAAPEELFEAAARGLVRALGLEAAEDRGSGRRGASDAAGDMETAAGDAGTAAGNAGTAAADDPGSGRAGGGEEERIEISRPDGERLLVEWLRGLLAGAMSGRGVPAAAVEQVRIPADGTATLRARVRWEPVAGEGPAREIKGVTYHGLVVERTGDRWHARVVLDV